MLWQQKPIEFLQKVHSNLAITEIQLLNGPVT